ncbi:DMT family transporter [Legionella drancourtii]|uniref:Integral membrane protein n=1 Tax=Legionella drancourtii LLAP12 TaxID=658187 RepID=G9EQV6_9GAMM|nr:DMT family transporter [Legionella drancourtii]EHL30327.1 integral membrane protein [Legionella drancourtii LLAP12]
MMTKEHRGSIYAILSGFLYGFIGYFGISAMNGHMSASTMLFWRFFISSSVILVVLFPQLKKPTDTYKQMRNAFLTGVVYYGLSTLLYFLACQYISSGLSMVIFFTYPVLIMLINFVVYKQQIPKIYYLAITVILLGMTFLVDMNAFSVNLWGIFFGIISAFFYAGYIIASKRNSLSPNMSTLMVCLGCMVTSLIVSLINHTFVFPSSSTVWLHLFGIAIVATVIPILLMLYSLKYISSEKASILSVLEPVFVVIFGILLLGESLRFLSAIGIVLILTGALITLFSHKIRLDLLRFNWLRSRAEEL